MKSSFSVKLLCILSAALAGASTLLPYVSAPVSLFGTTVSVKLIDSWEGYLVVGIAAFALLLALFGRYIFSLAGGFASLTVFIIENYNLPSGLDTGNQTVNQIARSTLTNDAGYYVLLAGSVALILFSAWGMIGKARGKKKT